MEDQKRRQVEYHEMAHYRASRPRPVDNSHPYVAWLNTYRLRKAVEMMGTPLRGKTVLSLCGGDGEEADFFQRQGADVTVVDLSTIALQAAQLRNPALHCLCMDAEALTFPARSFDWVVVRDGLHHLARPFRGFYELERVSRDGFVILEGQDSVPVRFLAMLGIAENWDPAGGYVYRFSRREIRKLFSSLQAGIKWKMHTAWLPFGADVIHLVPPFRRFVYPILQYPPIYRVLNTRPAKTGLRTLFELAESLTGRWGNSLIVVAHKPQ